MSLQDFDELDNADIDIGAGALAKLMSMPETRDMMRSIFTSPNQTKMLAKFLAQAISELNIRALKNDLLIKPELWFVEDGIIDDLTDEFEEIAEISGGQFDPSTLPALKQEVAALAKQLGENQEAQRQMNGVQSGLRA